LLLFVVGHLLSILKKKEHFSEKMRNFSPENVNFAIKVAETISSLQLSNMKTRCRPAACSCVEIEKVPSALPILHNTTTTKGDVGGREHLRIECGLTDSSIPQCGVA
jgi:hypothetical protein